MELEIVNFNKKVTNTTSQAIFEEQSNSDKKKLVDQVIDEQPELEREEQEKQALVKDSLNSEIEFIKYKHEKEMEELKHYYEQQLTTAKVFIHFYYFKIPIFYYSVFFSKI